jgi:hypothetical protein
VTVSDRQSQNGSVTRSMMVTVRESEQPPVVIAAPAPNSVVTTEEAVLQVVVLSTTEVRYEWTRNGLPIAGATNSVLRLTSPKRSDAGLYAVAVFNSVGAITNSGSWLRVLVPQVVSIARRPLDGTLVISSRDLNGEPLSDGDATHFQVWHTSDFKTWELHPSPPVIRNGRLELIDGTFTGPRQRFYRVVETP